MSGGEVRVAIAGTGFIGAVHARSARLAGARLVGVAASSPERGLLAAAALGAERSYATAEELVEAPDVDVVHICTPNHLHQPLAEAALAAGKHVICEKPLAIDDRGAEEMVEAAAAAGRVTAVPFVYRYYPTVREARERIRTGVTGQVRLIHGGYLQDWLLRPTDWNWRLEPEKGGALRAVADIGSHWLDLAQFVIGRRVESLLADLATTIPVRRRPAREIETFASADDVEREDAPMTTEDLAHILLRFGDGTRGSVVVSQVSAGRKNSLRFEVDGSAGALAWDSERNEELWLGHRGKPNELLPRDPSLFRPEASARTGLPAGHAEGFAETFKELYRAVYTAVAAGGPPDEPDYPTFADGHWENVLGDAVALSNRERRWVEVTT
jgi:predicted dehydrogenase